MWLFKGDKSVPKQSASVIYGNESDDEEKLESLPGVKLCKMLALLIR